MNSLSVLIPARNEELTIGSVIDSHYELLINLVKLGYLENFEIIVLNDGSTDKTSNIIDSYSRYPGILVLSNTESIGLQKAFKKLYGATSMSWTYLTPGDGQIPSNVLHEFILEAKRTNWKCAILGERDNKSDYSLFRKLISRVFRIYTSYILSQKINDVGTVKLVPSEINQKEYKCSSALQEIERIQFLIEEGYPIHTLRIKSLVRQGGKSKGVSTQTLRLVLKEITFLKKLKK
jgi:glycosyltransferase involved in cell wall biosynthesis